MYLREIICSEFISHFVLCTAFISNTKYIRDPCHKANPEQNVTPDSMVKKHLPWKFENKILFPIVLEIKIFKSTIKN